MKKFLLWDGVLSFKKLPIKSDPLSLIVHDHFFKIIMKTNADLRSPSTVIESTRITSMEYVNTWVLEKIKNIEKVKIKLKNYMMYQDIYNCIYQNTNKANLGDLIAATGLVTLLKFDPNHNFFSPCDLEIWCMTWKNNRAPLLYFNKLCVSFKIHRWIQTEVTIRTRSIRVKIGDFLSLVTLKFDGWPWKTIGHIFYTISSFVHHSISIGELKLKLQSRNAQFRSKSAVFCPVWPWNLTDALEKQ